ncbi:hypothetical protein ACX0G7_12685 [Flavitalea antarctica]
MMKDISVNYAEGEARPAFYFDDSRLVDLDNINVNRQQLSPQSKLIQIRNNGTISTR